MPSTNGHGPKRAILYARVSTDEQARSGFSLAQQLEAIRESLEAIPATSTTAARCAPATGRTLALNTRATRPRRWRRRCGGSCSACSRTPRRCELEGMIELERKGLRGDPDEQTKMWLSRIAEADRMRGGYQELAAKGLMTFEELGEKLAGLEATKRTAERELATLTNRREDRSVGKG